MGTKKSKAKDIASEEGSGGTSPNLSPDYREPVKYKGDGREDCPLCFGRGVMRKRNQEAGPPVVKRCKCVRRLDLARNIERGCAGLIRAAKVKESPFTEYVDENLWIHCAQSVAKAYLRRTAIDMGASWNFCVASDADLMAAWLASAKRHGAEIYDGDVMAQETMRYLSLEDLVKPPSVLILQLGVKSARNVAMPEVFLETLRIREGLNRPTWLLDIPSYPLAPGHLCWSEAVQDYVYHQWEHAYMDLSDARLPVRRRVVTPDVELQMTEDDEIGDEEVAAVEALIDEREEEEGGREDEDGDSFQLGSSTPMRTQAVDMNEFAGPKKKRKKNSKWRY